MRLITALALLAWSTLTTALPLETIKLPPGFSGLAWRHGALYVGAVSRILRYDDIDRRLERPPLPVTVTDSLPRETHHGWKFIAFGPDGKLYVPVGAPCNICEPGDPLRQHPAHEPGWQRLEVFARGVRNTVGFDWHPADGELWFTDNGRDCWATTSRPTNSTAPAPACTSATRIATAARSPTPNRRRASAPTSSRRRRSSGRTWRRSACASTPASDVPAEYRNQVFIAEHGSWNRSKKIGYRDLAGAPQGRQGRRLRTFASGWLQGESAWGRPADVLVLPDGSLLVADDHAGAIYRILSVPAG
jgi:glucose/arabinose dehydrogenase